MAKIMITMSLWQETLHDWPSPTQGDQTFLRSTADVKWVVLWSTILSVASDILENARQCHENALKDDQCGWKIPLWHLLVKAFKDCQCGWMLMKNSTVAPIDILLVEALFTLHCIAMWINVDEKFHCGTYRSSSCWGLLCIALYCNVDEKFHL